jgi:Uma2 family endonuclease
MTTAQRLTFEDYLNHDDGTEKRHELVNGRLIDLPPESEPHDAIANYLFLMLVNSGLPFRLIRPHTCEIQVPVLQAGDPANRFPDLVIIREEHLELTQKRLTITFDALPPQLVVEVVSPGLIDPAQKCIFILELRNGEYGDRGLFRGETQIASSLPELQLLQLTAAQLLNAVQ